MVRHKKGYWTIEKCIEEAKKYKHKTDFKKSSNTAYNILLKNNLIDTACKHMTEPDKIIKWHKNECIEAAKKCKTKSEFCKKYNGAYTIAKKKGWFDELIILFEPVGNKYNRCIYAYEFTDNTVYIGLTGNLKIRHISHMNCPDSAVFQHIKQYNLEPKLIQITEYIDYREASIKEGEILKKYIINGWKPLNRTKTGGLGSSFKAKKIDISQKNKNLVKKTNKLKKVNSIKYKRWNKEKCIEEAKKYTKVSHFIKKCHGAYQFALKNNFMNEIYELMDKLPHKKWTYLEAKNEASKYKTKEEFRNNSNGCYQVCQKNKWLDDFAKTFNYIDLKLKRIKYTKEFVIAIIKKYEYLEQLKKSDLIEVRGCYWWMKKNKLLQEFKKYLKK